MVVTTQGSTFGEQCIPAMHTFREIPACLCIFFYPFLLLYHFFILLEHSDTTITTNTKHYLQTQCTTVIKPYACFMCLWYYTSHILVPQPSHFFFSN